MCDRVVRPSIALVLSSWFVLLILQGHAFAQTVDEVVEQHLRAAGGRAALGKLTSRHSTGTMTVSVNGADIPGTVDVLAKAPNKVRVAMKLDFTAIGGESMTIEQRFDGTAGYTMNSVQGESAITGNQLANMKNATFPSPLLDYKDAGVKVELRPKEQVDGKEAIVLLMTPRTGPAARVYLDSETYLAMRSVTTVDSPQDGAPVEQTTDLSDYRTVDGVKVPFRIALKNPVQSVTLVFKTVEHNVPVDDAEFSKKSG
jgi:outer membrane lipoprotein-sorting protein